jgi:hypothetical protein
MRFTEEVNASYGPRPFISELMPVDARNPKKNRSNAFGRHENRTGVDVIKAGIKAPIPEARARVYAGKPSKEILATGSKMLPPIMEIKTTRRAGRNVDNTTISNGHDIRAM